MEMLLYGPPGCGKTIFAEKFAEEAQLNYIFIKASDIGSTYIHGSQGKIAQLFKDAEKNAPSVICLTNLTLWFQSVREVTQKA